MKFDKKLALSASLLALSGLAITAVSAEDWPEWGKDNSRNMTAKSKNIPIDIKPGTFKPKSEDVDMSTTKNVKWVAKLGSQSYGNPTVSKGKVFVGTNNETPRDAKYKGDRAAVYCLNEKTGELIWQFNCPKLGTGKVSDWEYLGICSSPAVDGDRIYIVTNRCQVICLDVNGLANGNQGYKDEAKYYADKGKPAVKLDMKKDGDILWIYDLREELGVFPHNITSSSILVAGDTLFVNTSNGVDWSHVHIPNPRAPVLIALNKKTGEYIAEETSGMSTRVLHGNWSSPALGTFGKQEMVIFGSGDGWIYAFDSKPGKDEDGEPVLKELWRCDGNPPEYRVDKNGKKLKYAKPEGPSEFIATPVVYKGKIFVPIGQDPEHGEGVGSMICIDPTKRGDISKTGKVWTYNAINRSISTVSVVDDIVYVGDFAGVVHALDAKTGKAFWTHDTQGHIWASTLVTDGKVIIGNEDGILTILKQGKSKKLLKEIEFDSAIYSSAIVANDVLYVGTHTHLYAIAKK